jgi:hypothetical protein
MMLIIILACVIIILIISVIFWFLFHHRVKLIPLNLKIGGKLEIRPLKCLGKLPKCPKCGDRLQLVEIYFSLHSFD